MVVGGVVLFLFFLIFLFDVGLVG